MAATLTMERGRRRRFFNYAWYVQMFADRTSARPGSTGSTSCARADVPKRSTRIIDEFAGLLNPGDGAGTGQALGGSLAGERAADDRKQHRDHQQPV